MSVTYTLILLALGAIVSTASSAEERNTAVIPAENPNPKKYNEYDWMERHEAVKARITKGPVHLVFIGDSIIHYFGGEPTAQIARAGEIWKRYYGQRNAVNMGFGWDRTEHALWRLEHGELEGIAPKVAVVSIGTNNLGANTPDQIADAIRILCGMITTKTPKTKILLLGILPRGEKPDQTREQIKAVNALIAKLDDGRSLFYLDIGPKFLNPDGTISKEVMSDFLHPTAKGYQILAESIEPGLADLLGERKVTTQVDRIQESEFRMACE